jgi:hypothetical protein
LVDAGFVLGRAEVAERGVQAAGVVPAFDPVEDRPTQASDGGPGATVDQFPLDGREKLSATALDLTVNYTRFRW